MNQDHVMRERFKMRDISLRDVCESLKQSDHNKCNVIRSLHVACHRSVRVCLLFVGACLLPRHVSSWKTTNNDKTECLLQTYQNTKKEKL